jgi:pimeloyl-ACP methyl ester carboxylesterase
MPTAQAGGLKLHYEVAGSGRPVVFVHGIPTDWRAWQAQVDELSKSVMTVALSRRCAFPNEGNGDVADSTVENNAADLMAFLVEVTGGRADLVGHSYGGFICAYLAAAHPQAVKSLTLVEPAVSTLLVADQTSQTQLLLLLLRSPSVALSGRRFQKGSLEPSLKALEAGRREEAVELNVDGVEGVRGAYSKFSLETRKMMLDNAQTVGELRTMFPRFARADASRIGCPTLVVNGDASPKWLGEIGVRVLHAVPGAKRMTVPGSRHFPHIQNPVAFNHALLEFLEGVPDS